MDFEKSLERLQERRRLPELSVEDSHYFESIQKNFSQESAEFSAEYLGNTPADKYVHGAMAALPRIATDLFYHEGERIRNQLETELSKQFDLYPEFRFQGSVTTKTHIKAVSDIDLLVLTEHFKTYKGGIPSNCYSVSKDEAVKYIEELRSACISVLKKAFPAATVDAKSKSIKTSGGSLKKDIDVVPSNWYITPEYNRTNDESDNGVRIFNAKTKEFSTNYPFKLVKLIDKKDSACKGNYRKLVRLIKSIKADSNENSLIQEISSYDIQGLVYNIPNSDLKDCDEFGLVKAVTDYVSVWYANSSSFKSLYVPDRTRTIAERVSTDALGALLDVLVELEVELGV